VSKESKPRDRWSQVFTAAADRPDEFCKGCGYYRVANGVHRADYTAECNIGGRNSTPNVTNA
jgi:hypothetical protein